MDSPNYSIDAEEELQNLYRALDEHAEVERGYDAEILAIQEENRAYASELDKYRDEIIKSNDFVAELRSQIEQLKKENGNLLNEKIQLEDQVKAHRSLLKAQTSKLAEQTESSDHAKKQQKDANQSLLRLELENQRLRTALHEIEENEDILVNEIEILVKERSEFQERCEELTSKCDSLYLDLDQKTRINSDVTQNIEKLQGDLECEQQAHIKCQEEWRQRDADSRYEITKLNDAIEKQKVEYQKLSDGSEYEDCKKQLENVRQENQRLISAYKECLNDKKQSERDLESAIQALQQSKLKEKELNALASQKEHSASAELKTKLDIALKKEELYHLRNSDIEEQLEELHIQLERSEERNSLYENNHGLADTARYQKKLEADIRRREYDLKQLNCKLGLEIESRRALAKACDWFKEKAKLPPDFMFDDDELREALQRDDNRLRSENMELLRQVESLEGERTKLLAQLRERAIDIGDKGLRFLGMDPQQVSQVLEFAKNLRNGVTDLPLNDRSIELNAEVTRLKSDREVDKLIIERLQREVFSISEVKSSASTSEDEVNSPKKTLDDMKDQNTIVMDAVEASTMTGSRNIGSALTPLMRERAKEILGENLVQMPAAAEVQFTSIMRDYDKTIQELASLKKNIDLRVEETNDLSFSNNDIDYILCERYVEHFRCCASVLCERNMELSSMVMNSQRLNRNLKKERDELVAELKRISNTTKSSIDHNEPRSDTNSIRLTVKCEALEAEVETELNEKKVNENDTLESQLMSRILFLEEWKVHAIEIIERQFKSLEYTVNKATFIEVLNELEKFRVDNIVLMDQIAISQVSLLKYREICKCLCHDQDNDQGVSAINNVSTDVSLNHKLKVMGAENSLLWEQIVAYEERENVRKSYVDDLSAKHSKILAKYCGGLTAGDAINLNRDIDTLKLELEKSKRSALEYKMFADLSVSQTTALLALRNSDQPEGIIFPIASAVYNDSKLTPLNTYQLEQSDRRLADAYSKIEQLQNTVNVLMSLMQRVIQKNSDHYNPIHYTMFGFDDCINLEQESCGIALSTATKMKSLINSVTNLQKEVNDKGIALTKSNVIIQQLNQLKELQSRDLHNLGTNHIENERDKIPHNEVFLHLIQSKTEVIDLQHELRQLKNQKKDLESRNQSLERINARLEKDLAKAALMDMAQNISKSHDTIGPLVCYLSSGDARQEMKKMDSVLKQTIEKMSQYVCDIADLRQVLYTIREHHLDVSRVSAQMRCLNDIIKEKNRIIVGFQRRLARAKQDNLKLVHEAAKLKVSDESSSKLGTNESIGYLARSSPKPNHETRLKDASRLLDQKDEELQRYACKVEELSKKLIAAEEASRCLGQRLDDTIKESERQKADISTLVSRLSDAESVISEYQRNIHVEGQEKLELRKALSDSKEAGEKIKSNLNKLLEERNERDVKICALQSDIQRTKQVLSIARQGKARSDHTLKLEKDLLISAREEINQLSAEVKDLKTKTLECNKDKRIASRKAKVAVSKLKEVSQVFSQETHDKTVKDLETRVDVLNRTVSGLAAQNSKLRVEMSRMKSGIGEECEKQKRHRSTSMDKLSECEECKRLGNRNTSLEQLLSLERKNVADSRNNLEMYQKRSFTLEQALQKYKSEESKQSSPCLRSSLMEDEYTREKEELKRKILKLSNENELLRQETTEIKNANTVNANISELLREKNSIKKENEKLKKRLQSFDLEFFEEIEDLKYKYNEAVRQLNQLSSHV